MKRQIKALVAPAALAVAALGLAHPAQAADDMGSNPITELFDAFGMGDKEKPDIDYRARPALVPPPSVGQLPPPQQRGAVAEATGQWPLDPDAERRAQRRALADVPRTEERDYQLDRNSRLSPSELNRKRTAEPDAAGVAGYSSPTYDNTIDRLSPSELQARKTQTADAVPAGAEPKRARLTDPPTGYRTPASTAPYKAPEADSSWYKKINPFSSEGR